MATSKSLAVRNRLKLGITTSHTFYPCGPTSLLSPHGPFWPEAQNSPRPVERSWWPLQSNAHFRGLSSPHVRSLARVASYAIFLAFKRLSKIAHKYTLSAFLPIIKHNIRLHTWLWKRTVLKVTLYQQQKRSPLQFTSKAPITLGHNLHKNPLL